MAGEPPITLVGNITADPEQRGDVASFTIAHNTRFRNRDGQNVDGKSIFMSCAAFGDLAQSLRFGIAQFQKTSGQQSGNNNYQQNNYGGGYQQSNNGYQQSGYNNYQQQGYSQQAPAQPPAPAQPAAPSQPAMDSWATTTPAGTDPEF